jgi:hypothetical protein
MGRAYTNLLVMRGLNPRIHQKDFLSLSGWIAGSSPAMTLSI